MPPAAICGFAIAMAEIVVAIFLTFKTLFTHPPIKL
jgi:hypothetical protein